MRHVPSLSSKPDWLVLLWHKNSNQSGLLERDGTSRIKSVVYNGRKSMPVSRKRKKLTNHGRMGRE